MTLIEAMSCGVPCISFDCPHGPRNIITDGKNGYLVEPYNIEALAERICHLIENEELRKEMGKEARKRAEDFTIDDIMGKWIKLFNSIDI
jgi:glycosyltransferase involved in cell wall biosynthesis